MEYDLVERLATLRTGLARLLCTRKGGGDVDFDFRLEVPSTLADKNLVPFFRGWTWIDPAQRTVVLDFSRCSFVAPWAVTMFAAYGRRLQVDRGKRVRVRLDERTVAGQFLVRAGLPRLLGDDSHGDLVPDADRYFPLASMAKSGEELACANSVLRLLSVDDEEMAEAIRYVLVELLRNVVQHSFSKIGGLVHAVYFPNTGLVEIAVADTGIGITASLQECYPEIRSDLKGVKFALQPHVSSTFARGAYHSMASNAGLGLFFIKEIVTRGGGGMFLASGQMLANLWGNLDGSPGRKYFQSESAGWGGTYVLLQLRRDMIVQFSSLLQRCREIAAEVRKDPTELKLDFIDEVPEVEQLEVVAVKEFEEDVQAAERVREELIMPSLQAGRLVVIDFSGTRVATQSFVHALMYRVLRDSRDAVFSLSVACADPPTREAIRAVAAYAKVSE